MNKFERIRSGLPGLDTMLDSVRLGDNVVWQVSDIDEFRCVVGPFIRQSIAEGRKTVYIRFAQHPALAEPAEGLGICELDPSSGFEAFTVRVHEIVTEAGPGAHYVFDSLSELQETWFTDLMMGSFFRVTCPYLFQLDTVAYFPIKRGMHSFETIAQIRETTQLFIELYHSGDEHYIHPLKVWNRYSSEMFLPHRIDYASGSIHVLDDSVSVSRFYAFLNGLSGLADRNTDSWDRFFSLLKFQFDSGMLPEGYGPALCSRMMTKDEKIADMIVAHFSPRDYFLVRDRMIGTGLIGGKACGILLARKLAAEYLPELAGRMEPHDSYYIGSDVFYTYIVYNDCWKLRIEQRMERAHFKASEKLGKRLKSGAFPENIREQFRHMLDYFGQSPIIVRSSSFLEDGSGYAFAGKYESVFCAGGGDSEQRLKEFEDAVRTVYASTMNPSALEYRRLRGLLEKDEQMAVLVQRVSGARHGDLYMPAAAGVGYSYNAYRWLRDGDSNAGMLRLVAGLGTRAVGRTEGDYPRIVSLDRPRANNFKNLRDRHRFSQHQADVLDLRENRLCEREIDAIKDNLPEWLKRLTLSHDTEAEQSLAAAGRRGEVLFCDCQGLIENRGFIDAMKKILSTLQEKYGSPVDIEFTVNGSESGEFMINLLQCRALKVGAAGSVSIPDRPDGRILFDIADSAMGRSRRERLDVVVMVDPHAYYSAPYAKKAAVARAIGEINRHYHGKDKKLMLIVPGRIGTSSPELGVPVVYAEISIFRAVCEVAYSKVGYMPELSYGSHMFQDLVESDIFYGAVFEDARTRIYNPQLLGGCANLLPLMPGRAGELSDIIGVYDVSGAGLTLSFDMLQGRALCAFD